MHHFSLVIIHYSPIEDCRYYPVRCLPTSLQTVCDKARRRIRAIAAKVQS